MLKLWQICLLIVATLIILGCEISLIYGAYYYIEEIPDESIVKCHWIKDVYLGETGCIHHRILQLDSTGINVSTPIFQNCEINAFNSDKTYWCQKSHNSSSYLPLDAQPLISRNDRTFVMCFVGAGVIGFGGVLPLCALSCSGICQYLYERQHNEVPTKRRSTKKYQRRCSTQNKTQNKTPNEMPQWV